MFNAEKTRDALVEWIKETMRTSGGENAVIGISGGKDSTIVAALCVRALGKEKVYGVLMPNGTQKDISDSKKVCECLGISSEVINIKEAVDAIRNNVSFPFEPDQARYNLPPRVRMTTLYYVAQNLPNGRVINTSNASERYIGWSTRWGDSVGDIAPLLNLTATEIIEIGTTMSELPIDLVIKAPADGLTTKTDEDNFGFTYEVLDKYIRTGVCEDHEIKELIDKKHKASEFKRQDMPSFNKIINDLNMEEAYNFINERDKWRIDD